MIGPPAIAVFVKTPGLSPVKTRLAGRIGDRQATQFYQLCVRSIEAVLTKAARQERFTPYWAIAESTAFDHPQWRSFERLNQGPGGLGERLDRVYRELLERHSCVLLVGADAPLMSIDLICAARDAISVGDDSFAICPSDDGGYSLFAGRVALPTELWTGVPYSESSTTEVFIERLKPFGRVAVLETVNDVDAWEDLTRLVADAADRSLLPEQRDVVRYAGDLVGLVSGDG